MRVWLLLLLLAAVPVALVVALVGVHSLRRRVAALEQALERLQAGMPQAQAAACGPEAPPAAEPRPMQAAAAPAARAVPPPLPPRPGQAPAAAADGGTASARPGVASRLWERTRRGFAEGNVPVKIGVLVLLAGVAALLKYASDRGLLALPVELRLAGVAAAAVGALVFAWHRRGRHRAFALSVQGGAIGVLLLTVFAAFKLYGLLPAGAAFALSVLLVAGTGLLAVLQDARALAVLALLAGFLAPLWLSTGSGNHVALFSYYALLDAAIVAIARHRAWRELNLLGFAFTFGIGAAWGAWAYRPGHYASTQPFLVLFFLFYLAVPVLLAGHRARPRQGFVDGTLVFGTPLVAFALQAGLMQGQRMPLALCALGLAALYAVLARVLVRREGFGLLGQAHAVLAVGFATLAVPLALSAHATASVFALEGAGLVWLGLRQQRRLPVASGAVLQLLAGVAVLLGSRTAEERLLLNPGAMAGLLLAVGGLASAWAARAQGRAWAFPFHLWGLLWWTGTAVAEVFRFLAPADRPDALLAFAALTGWLAAEAWRRRGWGVSAATAVAALAAALPLACWQAAVHLHPFAGHGAPAWLAFAVLGLRGLRCLRGGDAAGPAQLAWWPAWALALALAGTRLGGEAGLAQGWRLALLALPWLALLAAALWRWPWLALPSGLAAASPWRCRLQGLVLLVLACGWLPALAMPASAAPLPWLPLLNPAGLAQLAAVGLAAAWLGSAQAPEGLRRARGAVLGAAVFLLASAATLRGVHHWGGVAWGPRLPLSGLAQTSLTVVWSVLGVLGWVAGSRRGLRTLWLAGAVLMGVVLLKLVLVDRQHLGNLPGIVSFIAYGVLCTIVGYLAPAPPRRAASTEEEARHA